MKRELEIPVPRQCIIPVQVEDKDVDMMSTTYLSNTNVNTNTSTIVQPQQFHSFSITIDYSIDVNKLNFGSISFYNSLKSPQKYFQLTGIPFDGMGRYLFPCLDFPGERIRNWDLEYSVLIGKWTESFDRIHLVSSGVLCRQFVNEDKTCKVFHYKIQDIPCLASQISFLVGIFEAVKIPNVPFAYAFSPIGKAGKLANCMDFMGKAFNFYNWYLNSSSGNNLRTLSSLSSEVFPFPSYYLIFLKDFPYNSESHHQQQPFLSFANLTILSSDLLHDAGLIDQTFETRRILCKALAEQYFSLRIDLKSTNDYWIMKGIVEYLSEIQLKTFHGNNDYRLKIKTDTERVVLLENSENLHVPPLGNLFNYFSTSTLTLNPCDRSLLEEVFTLKSRLIFILLEKKIESTFLQKILSHIYGESLINRNNRDPFSFQLFLKLIKRLTGKDLKSFTDQWIYNSPSPAISLSFLHNRKRAVIEFEVNSQQRRIKFSGNLNVRIVESETIFHEHVVHIDELTTKFEVPFHAKAKKPRKKKGTATAATTVATTSSSANINAGNDFDSQDEDQEVQNQSVQNIPEDEETIISPISWIRIDPEMEWIAQFNLAQPDIMWIEALENDRDVVAQWEAVRALPLVSSTSESVCFALERFINDWKAFWAVRVEAINSIALIGTSSIHESSIRLLGARKLVELFNKKFGNPNSALIAYPKSNSFEMFSNYFVQSAIPRGISLAISCIFRNIKTAALEDLNAIEPFLAFFSSILRFNDNSGNNSYSDGEYLASIIRAGTGAFAQLQSDEMAENRFFRLKNEEFFTQLNRYAMLETLLPSHKNSIMIAVLEACVVLRPNTQLLSYNSLQSLLRPENNTQVRLEALKLFISHFIEEGNAFESFELLKLVCRDRSVEFRRKAIVEPCIFELLQFLLHSMEEGMNLKEWLIGEECSLDFVCWKCLLSAVGTLEGSSVTEDINIMSTAAAVAVSTAAPTTTAKSLKITFNIGNVETAAIPSNGANSSATTTNTFSNVPSIDDDDDIWLRELTGDNTRKKTTVNNGNNNGTSEHQTIQNNDINSANNTIDESERLHKVWQSIWSNYDSIPFRYPVDPSVPGYYAIIKSPMDLSTISDSKFPNLHSFLMDLRLIFQNCFTFNQTDSLIYDQAKRLRSLAINELKNEFPREKKMIKRILKAAQEDFNVLQSIERIEKEEQKLKNTNTTAVTVDEDVFDTKKQIRPKVLIKIPPPTAQPATTTTTTDNLIEISASDRLKLKNILLKLCKHRHAYFFMEPVDPIALNIPTYFSVIKHPMDFGTIKDNLQNQNYYKDVAGFVADCRLVFANCKVFNNPETLVHQVAVEMEKSFEEEWSKFISSPKKKQHAVVEVPKIKLSLNFGSLKK